MIDADQRRRILERAYISEHSPDLMTIVSGGEAHLFDEFIVYAGDGWVVVNGYPLEDSSGSDRLEAIVERACGRFRPRYLWVVAPRLPDSLRTRVCERQIDEYYRLDLEAFRPPRRLMREVERAAERLFVERTREMGPDHAAMTVEFIRHVNPHERVTGLYRAMPEFIRQSQDALVLSARTPQGRLVAYCVMDMAPVNFASYVVGCHSRTVRAPHASDLLFLEMAAAARGAGKRYIDLGLGVHDGIRRFKTKWGAGVYMPYEMCEILMPEGERCMPPNSYSAVPEGRRRGVRIIADVLRSVRGPKDEYRMLWELCRGEVGNLLGGTSHFFCRSYRGSFQRILAGVDRVLFEGPLGEESMRRVRESGLDGSTGVHLFDALDPATRSKIAREFAPRGLRTAMHAGLPPNVRTPIEDEICRGRLEGMKPWLAYFAMWTEFIQRRGWSYVMDMEAHEEAKRLGKEIIYLESIEEQIEAMEGIPFDAIVDFLQRIDEWDAIVRGHPRRFMRGDLDGVLRVVGRFPTRCESIIDCRDPVFFERMVPYLERGGAAVLVGTSHIPGLIRRLEEAGWSVRPVGR